MKYSLAVLTLAASTVAQAVPDTGPVAAKFRSQRKWSIALPNETFVKIGTSIELGGCQFTTRSEGTGLAVDTDGDGTTDVTVQGEGGFVKLQKDGFRYALRLVNRGGGWHYATSCLRQAKVRGQRLRLIDQNGNGRFSDVGVDAMILGRGETATFLSRVINVDREVLSMEVSSDGGSVTLTPYEGDTGTLDLTSSLETKGKLLSAIVRSVDGALSFDLARGALSVPTGTYRIHSGTIGLGETTVDVRRGRAADLVVDGGATVALDWGGPATAEFDYRRQDGKLEFSPAAVWYYGDSGEEYRNWNPVGKSPTFEVREDGEVIATAIFPGSC